MAGMHAWVVSAAQPKRGKSNKRTNIFHNLWQEVKKKWGKLFWDKRMW